MRVRLISAAALVVLFAAGLLLIPATRAIAFRHHPPRCNPGHPEACATTTATTATTAPTTTVTSPTGSSTWAGLALGFRINSRSSTDQDYELNNVVDLNAGTVRIDGANGAVIDKLVARGIEPVIIIGSNPSYPWSTTAVQYGATCGSLAATYAGKVAAWEVMNEPDLHGWTPQTYFPYLQACYQQAKLSDPNVEVWPGGIWKWQMDSGGSLYSNDWYEQLYAAGAKQYMDAINIHAYDDPDVHGWWSAWDLAFGYPGGPYETRNIRSIADSYGDSAKPIVVTEAGGPTPKYTLQQQADIVTHDFNYVDGVGVASWRVKSLFVYCLMPDDGTVPPSDQFSLLDASLAPRPAYFAFQTAAT